MRLDNIEANKKESINVIIETPRGSQNKFVYDPELKLFGLKKTLPMGTVFPFDFGFIPNTVGPDGDPLDVLVIMEEPAYPGCLIPSRLIGILEAKQKEPKEKFIRNDRLIAVSDCSVLYADIDKLSDLNKSMVTEIENFFIDYNKHEGKNFVPLRWCGPKDAVKLIKKSKK